MKQRLFLFTICYCCVWLQINAQPITKQKRVDSLLVEKLINKANLDVVLEDLTKEERKDSKLIDSLLNESKERYNDGTVTYSPDNKFKIIVIIGDGVGASVYNIYTSFVYLPKTKIKLSDDDCFFPIIHIYQLGINSYLVLHGGVNGSAIYTYNNLSATVLNITNNQLSYPAVNYGASGLTPQKGTIAITQNQFILDDDGETPDKLFKLTYNTQSQIINYSYLSQDENNRVFANSGIFKYSNGTFVFQKEIKKRIK